MSLKSKKKITSHMRFLCIIFVLPIVCFGVSNKLANHKNKRKPTSINHSHHKEMPTPIFQKMSPIRQTAKARSTFGIKVDQDILEYDPSSGVSIHYIKVTYEAFVDTDTIHAKVRLPSGYTLLEGKDSEEFFPMRAGEQNTFHFVIQGNPFTASAGRVEVFSVIDNTKFGAVSSLKLRKSLSAHIQKENGIEPEEEKKAFSEKANPSKKFKLIF